MTKKEVILATGCTEPIVVTPYIAKAAKTLEVKSEKIDVLSSANILKNAMGVGIPRMGMAGLPIAVVLDTLVDKSGYQLEVLRDCTPEMVEQGKRFVIEKRICISLKEDIMEKPHIEVVCKTGDRTAKTIIVSGHTTFIYIAKDKQALLDKQHTVSEEEEDASLESNLRKAYDSMLTASLDEVRFIPDITRLDKATAEQAFRSNCGHSLGKMLRGTYEYKVMGDSVSSHILSYTSAACDARMAGAMIPVMSNPNSGNQGTSATLPVVVFTEKNGKSEEELTRALVLSHLTVIYIKQSLGRLLALCGCMVTATGSSCGIIWSTGGNYNQVAFAVQNMITDLIGTICNDARPSCTPKVITGASTVALSVMMITGDRCVTSVGGIIDEDAGQGIRNLTGIGSQTMNEMNRMVLDIMTHKGC